MVLHGLTMCALMAMWSFGLSPTTAVVGQNGSLVVHSTKLLFIYIFIYSFTYIVWVPSKLVVDVNTGFVYPL